VSTRESANHSFLLDADYVIEPGVCYVAVR
jgi:hypothetical protein